MKSWLFTLSCFLFFSCQRAQSTASSVNDSIGSNPATSSSETSGPEIPRGARALLQAYPDFIKGYAEGKLQLADGTEIPYDDGREKTYIEKLDNADPEDMFAFTYDRQAAKPGEFQDAGRARCETLFIKMYDAASEQSVRRHFTNVDWFGSKVPFTTINGADKALRAVAEELSKYPDLRPYLQSSGSFNYRKVRGANRLSAHSFGMTIDIGVKYSNYWLWENKGAKETDRINYRNQYPMKIVEIFEKHGFIWGGRWYHYDTMHFEYRPEILIYSAE